jgi:hypothetical protein
MSNAIIRAALETTLATYATAQGLSVAYENRSFTPATGVTYLRAFLLPGATDSQDLGRLHRKFVGVFQVSIVMPLGTGPGAGEALAVSLAAAFPPATPIVRSGITTYVMTPMSSGPHIQEQDRYVIPCSLTYQANTY